MNTAKRQTLVVFTENEFNRAFLQNLLEQFLHGYLEIIPLSSATRHTLTQTPKAVVASIFAEPAARALFPDSEIICTQRLVSGDRLEKVIALPPGTPVLVANKPLSMAEETVRNLTDMGINHIRLQPYSHEAGIDTAGYDTVIYTGTRDYAPDGKKAYINIGHRGLSQSTLARIMKVYNIPFDALEHAYHNHAKMIVRGLYRLQDSLQESTKLQRNFEQVCVLSTNALINIDGQGKVVMFNPAAEGLLGKVAAEALGQPYGEVLHEFSALCKMVAREADATDQMIYIHDHAVLATMRLVNIEESRHVFLSLVRVESLMNTEEKARANIYRKGFVAKYAFDDIKGTSAVLRDTVTLANYYAQADATVLITGESGTGKELFAQSIHNASPRARGPFVGVNFAAIPENLMESELFGYDEGAFTGASKGGKAGLFRSAHHGTIFLDEIGDVSPSMQSRLLRVLEEREIMPVGSSRVIPVDVRIICATNRNLPQMVAEGKFREDLYYRLKVFTLRTPSLRERLEDVPVILESMTGVPLPAHLRDWFMSYDWPGNIRELKSIAQHFSLFSKVPSPDSEEGRIWQGILTSFFRDSGFTPRELPPSPSARPVLQEGDLALLRCIDEMNRAGQSAGRYSLARHPAMVRLGMTEARIKLRLSHLKETGYLLAGRTRQGVALSPLGKGLLEGR
ncbi:sigma-54 interaction domain-containing protein [Intestinibacillus massiliensis]